MIGSEAGLLVRGGSDPGVLVAAALALFSLSLFVVANEARRRGWVGGEQARKTVHVVGSFIAAGLPWLASEPVLLLASLLLAILLVLADALGWFQGLSEARTIRGSLWFLVAFALLLASDVAAIEITAGFAVLGAADAAAALAGTRWGRTRLGPGFDRTWVGTLTFAAVAFALVLPIGLAVGTPWGVALTVAASVALASAAAEAITPSSLDNLVIPLLVALLFGVERHWTADRATVHAAELAFSLGFVAIAGRRRWLTGDGCLAVLLLGLVPFACAGWRAVSVLFGCFAVIIVLTHLRAERAVQQDIRGRRATQIAAFGVIPALASFVFARTEDPTFLALVGVAAAAAAADAWATEIGRLHPGDPVMIGSWRSVPRGTSGGVTWLGVAASVVGAFLIAALATWTGLFPIGQLVWVGGIAVLAGLLDSVLGASLQGIYRCGECEAVAEVPTTCHEGSVLIKGRAWINNETVNLIATLFAATLYLVVAWTVL